MATSKSKPSQRLPSKTDLHADTILARLEGGESLKEICRTPGMPSFQRVLAKVEDDPLFADRYTRARAIGYAKLAEEILEISDEADVITVPQQGGGTRIALDATAVARNRLRVDTRKWILAKMLPKVYGDKTTIDANVNVTSDDLLLHLAGERKK